MVNAGHEHRLIECDGRWRHKLAPGIIGNTTKCCFEILSGRRGACGQGTRLSTMWTGAVLVLVFVNRGPWRWLGSCSRGSPNERILAALLGFPRY